MDQVKQNEHQTNGLVL